MSVQFNEETWVLPAGIGRVGEWDEETREHIHNLRDFNPEIKHLPKRRSVGFSEKYSGYMCNVLLTKPRPISLQNPATTPK